MSTTAGVSTIGVLTQHNNNARTGANLNETILNTSNVNARQFGKLFELPVDGQVYAQPLYVSAVSFADQSVRNVVYIATMHNTVYAFDADDPGGTTIWQASLGPAIPLPDPGLGDNTNYHDISLEVGILSTPVISLDKSTLYVVAATKENGQYFHRLHALDLLTGVEVFDQPTVIEGSVKGNGSGSSNGVLNFQSHLQNQRPGLLLANDTIYIAFASYGDADPYHGWIFGYSASTLQCVAIFCSTPGSQMVNGKLVPDGRGGIWQAGLGLAADNQGLIYAITGNGSFRADGSALGDCIIKLRPDLTVLDWFSPFNNNALNGSDEDLGSSGVVLLPETDLVIGGGKESKLYVMHKNNMGHFNSHDDNQIVQTLLVHAKDGPSHHIHAGPTYWHGPRGAWIYVWVENDFIRAFQFVNGKFQPNPVSQHANTAPSETTGMPGGALSLSADGSKPGSGILWASHPHDQDMKDLKGNIMDANQHIVRGILRAYDASDLSRELWNSQLAPGDSTAADSDSIGNFAKFCPPTIANGKVYLASFGRNLIGTSPAVAGLDRSTFHIGVYGLKQ
ncbi:MAG: hypothetical protein NVS4B9_31070 [Ktedonobacteraceae bacterium]